jgi:hypothetical protein
VRDFHIENTSPSEPAMLDTELIVPETSSETPIQLLSTISEASSCDTTIPKASSCDSLTKLSSSVKVPLLWCVDKPSTSLPNHITCTEDFLRASVGFKCIDTMKTHLQSLYLDTLSLDSLPADAVLDAGDFATIKKSARNTQPVPRPSSFSEVIHMDIEFGTEVSLGNVHFALLFTDYDGLESLPYWEVNTEDQYKQLSKGRRALPTMAIASIKYDANNRHKRAKYFIVVLGNLDYHTWSREETTAPVMSQLELCLLTSLAIYHKRVLKNCNVKQAFIQSSLPEMRNTFYVRPLDVQDQNLINNHLLKLSLTL